MSVTVQEIYSRVCEACLENNGLTLGIFTQAQFLNLLSVVLLDFSQRAALDKHIWTTMINAGVSDYLIPDDVMEAHLCFVGGKIIEKVSAAELGAANILWRRKWKSPEKWHEDNLEVKHIEVSPKPDYNGTNIAGSTLPIGKYGDFYPTERNLTVVGPAAPSKTTWVLGDTLDGIPDSFAPYLAYGILAQIFDSETEIRDVQRALYCRTRYEECIAIAEAIAREELLEEED